MYRSAIAALIVAGLLSASARAEETEIKVTPDVVYGHKYGLAMTIDVFQPETGANGAAVMFMVSGGWFSRWSPPEHGLRQFKPLLDEGFTVFSVRHGSSPKFDIPEVVSDVRRAVRFIRLNAEKFGIDPNRLGVYGGSAGGHLSLMLGTTSDAGNPDAKDPIDRQSNRLAAVVAYYPPTDIRPWVTDPESSYYKNYPALQFDPQKAGDYSPLLQVSADDPPTLLIHGDQDKLVPLEHSEKILSAFKEQGVKGELLEIPGAAHGFRGEDAVRVSKAMVAWFQEHLTRQEP